MNLIKKTFLMAGLGAALALPAFAESEKEKEGTIEWKDVPAVVQAAITQHAAGGEVLKVERENEKDGVEYEAKIKMTDGKTHEIKLKADGTIVKDDDEHEADEHDGHDHAKADKD